MLPAVARNPSKRLSQQTQHLDQNSQQTQHFDKNSQQYLEERLALYTKAVQRRFVADKDVENADHDGNDDDMLDGERGLKFKSVVMSPPSFSCFSDSVREMPEICTASQTFIFTQYWSSSSFIIMLELNRSN